MEAVEAVNPIAPPELNDTVQFKTIYMFDTDGLFTGVKTVSDDYSLLENETLTELPEYEPGKSGFADGSRPQFDPDTNTWQPYKEPVEPSPEMQAINRLGMLVAQQLGKAVK